MLRCNKNGSAVELLPGPPESRPHLLPRFPTLENPSRGSQNLSISDVMTAPIDEVAASQPQLST